MAPGQRQEAAYAKWLAQVNTYLSQHKLTVRAFFKRFDRDGDGFLTTKEVREALKEFKGIDLSLQEIRDLVKFWDDDGSGTVDYGEFTKGLKYTPGRQSSGGFGRSSSSVGSKPDRPKQLRKRASSSSAPATASDSSVGGSPAPKRSQSNDDDVAEARGPLHPESVFAKWLDQVNAYLSRHKLTARLFYKRFDRDGDGFLTTKEVKAALKEADGLELSNKEIGILVSYWDDDGSGTVDYGEFTKGLMYTRGTSGRASKPRARRGSDAVLDQWTQSANAYLEDHNLTARDLFDSFDLDGDGALDADELSIDLAAHPELSLPADKLDLLIRAWDLDGSQTIDYLEFTRGLARKTKQGAPRRKSSGRSGSGGARAGSSGPPRTRSGGRGSPRNEPSRQGSGGRAPTPTLEELVAKKGALHPDTVFAKWLGQVNGYLAHHKLTARAFYKRFDRDGDGFLTSSEVKEALKEFDGLDLSSKEIKVLIGYWDDDKSGTVDYREFTKGLKYSRNTSSGATASSKKGRARMSLRPKRTAQDAALDAWTAKANQFMRSHKLSATQLFEAFDVDGDGFLDATELRTRLLAHEELSLPEATVEKLIAAWDDDGSRTIDYLEFSRGLQCKPKRGPSSNRNRQRALKTPEQRTPTPTFAELRKAQGDLHPETVFAKWLLQANAHLVRHELSARALYQQLDGDGDGFLTAAEAKEGLKQLDTVSLSDAEVDILLHCWDTDNSGTVDYREFTRGIKYVGLFDSTNPNFSIRPRRTPFDGALDEWAATANEFLVDNSMSARELFASFDEDGDGVLSATELAAAVSSHPNLAMPQDRIATLVKAMDADGSGTIDYLEFSQGLRRKDKRAAATAGIARRQSSGGSSTTSQRSRTPESLSRLSPGPGPGTIARRRSPKPKVGSGLRHVANASPVTAAAPTYAELKRDKGELHEETVFAKWLGQVNDFLAYHKLTVRAFYKRFDRDGDGFLTTSEIKAALKEFQGLDLNSKEIKILIRYWDDDKSGTVDYREFTKGLKYSANSSGRGKVKARRTAQLKRDRILDEWIAKANDHLVAQGLTANELFDSFDADGNGSLDAQELQTALLEHPTLSMSEEKIEILISAWDEDDDKRIDYLEFSKGMKRKEKRSARRSARTAAATRQASTDSPGPKELTYEELLATKGALHPDTVFAKWLGQVNGYLAHHKLTARAFYKRFDRDGDGFLTSSEVKEALKEFDGLDLSSKEIKVLIGYWDDDKSGTVDYREFTKGLKYSFGKRQSSGGRSGSTRDRDRGSQESEGALLEEWLANANGYMEAVGISADELFQEFDVGGVGQLDAEELIDLLEVHDALSGSREQLAELVRIWDVDGDGTIDFLEFTRGMKFKRKGKGPKGPSRKAMRSGSGSRSASGGGDRRRAVASDGGMRRSSSLPGAVPVSSLRSAGARSRTRSASSSSSKRIGSHGAASYDGKSRMDSNVTTWGARRKTTTKTGSAKYSTGSRIDTKGKARRRRTTDSLSDDDGEYDARSSLGARGKLRKRRSGSGSGPGYVAPTGKSSLDTSGGRLKRGSKVAIINDHSKYDAKSSIGGRGKIKRDSKVTITNDHRTYDAQSGIGGRGKIQRNTVSIVDDPQSYDAQSSIGGRGKIKRNTVSIIDDPQHYPVRRERAKEEGEEEVEEVEASEPEVEDGSDVELFADDGAGEPLLEDESCVSVSEGYTEDEERLDAEELPSMDDSDELDFPEARHAVEVRAARDLSTPIGATLGYAEEQAGGEAITTPQPELVLSPEVLEELAEDSVNEELLIADPNPATPSREIAALVEVRTPTPRASVRSNHNHDETETETETEEEPEVEPEVEAPHHPAQPDRVVTLCPSLPVAPSCSAVEVTPLRVAELRVQARDDNRSATMVPIPAVCPATRDAPVGACTRTPPAPSEAALDVGLPTLLLPDALPHAASSAAVPPAGAVGAPEGKADGSLLVPLPAHTRLTAASQDKPPAAPSAAASQEPPGHPAELQGLSPLDAPPQPRSPPRQAAAPDSLPLAAVVPRALSPASPQLSAIQPIAAPVQPASADCLPSSPSLRSSLEPIREEPEMRRAPQAVAASSDAQPTACPRSAPSEPEPSPELFLWAELVTVAADAARSPRRASAGRGPGFARTRSGRPVHFVLNLGPARPRPARRDRSPPRGPRIAVRGLMAPDKLELEGRVHSNEHGATAADDARELGPLEEPRIPEPFGSVAVFGSCPPLPMTPAKASPARKAHDMSLRRQLSFPLDPVVEEEVEEAVDEETAVVTEFEVGELIPCEEPVLQEVSTLPQPAAAAEVALAEAKPRRRRRRARRRLVKEVITIRRMYVGPEVHSTTTVVQQRRQLQRPTAAGPQSLWATAATAGAAAAPVPEPVPPAPAATTAGAGWRKRKKKYFFKSSPFRPGSQPVSSLGDWTLDV